MRRVNGRTQTPIPATVLPVVLGCILMAVVPGDALLELLTVGGVIGASLYGAIVVPPTRDTSAPALSGP